MKEHVCGHRGVTASSIRGQQVRATARPAKVRQELKAPFILFVGWFNHRSFKKDLLCV